MEGMGRGGQFEGSNCASHGGVRAPPMEFLFGHFRCKLAVEWVRVRCFVVTGENKWVLYGSVRVRVRVRVRLFRCKLAAKCCSRLCRILLHLLTYATLKFSSGFA